MIYELNTIIIMLLGRAVAQAVSRWLPTAAARVRVRAGMWGLWWTKRQLWQVFSEYFGFPYQSSFHQFFHWGYRAFTVASCAKAWRDNHDLILHTSLYCMWYRTYTSELYRQLSLVDLTPTVYIKHLMLLFVSRVSIKSFPGYAYCYCWNSVSFVAVGTCLPGRCLANDVCYSEIGRCLT
jgi:hypothetical protein